MSHEETSPRELSEVEKIKGTSNYLRGTIRESVDNRLTGAVTESDLQLMKFHGMYQQDDRDVRNERARRKLEPAYSFMIRVRAPGGIVTPEQWLTLDQLARDYAGETLRLTTRQSFQLHGIIKWELQETIQTIDKALLDSLAACGDVNRNTMCNPNPYQSEVHEAVYEWSKRISEHLSPRTQAYHEIWLGRDKVADSRGQQAAETGVARTDDPVEPIYGKSYLPRKFKIAIAVPPSNDVDVYAHDLGFIAIAEKGELIGFNVCVGGGMGMTYGEPETFPNLGWVIGSCTPKETLEVAEAVASIQRDYGNRSNRKRARLKYTIDDHGLEWFMEELRARRGKALAEPAEITFEHNGDRLGWVEGTNGRWHLTIFIENGRIRDWEDYPLMTGLNEIAQAHDGDFRLTPNQNLVIGNVSAENKERIERLVERHGLKDGKSLSGLRRNAMACVAMPTCGMAMAEAERYLPALLGRIESILDEAGLRDEEIVVRMSGCPNGCSRPYLGEIGLTGKAPGKYNLYIGAGFAGDRLNRLYRENIGEEEILSSLSPIIHHYAQSREAGERFGDFVVRSGYVAAVTKGRNFHSEEIEVDSS